MSDKLGVRQRRSPNIVFQISLFSYDVPPPHPTMSGHAIGGVFYAKHMMVKRHIDRPARKMTTIQQKHELEWHRAVVRPS
ncbi:hypothetical protein BS47DRAFT_1345886 [Hydnum rufescens UP504]|uniref:Uncharacterized protein n=1 Tax=Hydnum rufescens UP504 TaxID=1448309 RepID=A0A9P6AUS2_9AGAM|nr:hypothetical protein BS47DRAFT_1345886 [Hydnum rufescens UP504]